MDLSDNEILIVINKKMYRFKSSYKTAKFFNDENNIREIKGLTDEMKFILTRPHQINRVIKLLKREDQDFFLKESTKNKYCNIPNFSITRI
jgi:hypothetical protein